MSRNGRACVVAHHTRVVSPGVPPVQVLLSRVDPDVPVPSYARPGDAAVDLVSTSDQRIEPGERVVVGTGIAVALPEGYAGFVQPRSGLAARVGLSVVNTPGLIDSGFRGEILICLINHDLRESIVIHRGDRIAQFVIQRVETAEFVEVEDLGTSERGAKGYGSSGGHSSLLGKASSSQAASSDVHS